MERKRVGFPANAKVPRRNRVSASVGQRTTQELFQYDVLNIQQNGNGGIRSIDRRENQTINLKSIEIKYRIHNTSTALVVMRMALLHCKKDTRVDLTGVNETNLLRGYGDVRHETLAGNSSLHQLYNPINSDDYNVLWQTRVVVIPPTGTTVDDVRHSSDVVRRHIVNINKEIRYRGPNGDDSEDILRLVFWFVDPEAATVVPGDAVTKVNVVRMWTDVVTHYTDSKPKLKITKLPYKKVPYAPTTEANREPREPPRRSGRRRRPAPDYTH